MSWNFGNFEVYYLKRTNDYLDIKITRHENYELPNDYSALHDIKITNFEVYYLKRTNDYLGIKITWHENYELSNDYSTLKSIVLEKKQIYRESQNMMFFLEILRKEFLKKVSFVQNLWQVKNI